MKKILIITALFLIVITPSCYLLKKSSDYYGVDLNEKRYVFLIDISGSMEGKIEKDAKGKVIGMATNNVANAIGNQIGGELGGLVSEQIKKSLTKL